MRGHQTKVNNLKHLTVLDRQETESEGFRLISTWAWNPSSPSCSSPTLQTPAPPSSSDGPRPPHHPPDLRGQTQAIRQRCRQTTHGRRRTLQTPCHPPQPSPRHPPQGWQGTAETICGLGPQIGREITLCGISPATPFRSLLTPPPEPREGPPRSISRLITTSRTLPSIPLSTQPQIISKIPPRPLPTTMTGSWVTKQSSSPVSCAQIRPYATKSSS